MNGSSTAGDDGEEKEGERPEKHGKKKGNLRQSFWRGGSGKIASPDEEEKQMSACRTCHSYQSRPKVAPVVIKHRARCSQSGTDDKAEQQIARSQVRLATVDGHIEIGRKSNGRHQPANPHHNQQPNHSHKRGQKRREGVSHGRGGFTRRFVRMAKKRRANAHIKSGK